MHTFVQNHKSVPKIKPACLSQTGRSHLGQSSEVRSILSLQRMIVNQAEQRLHERTREHLKASQTDNTSPNNTNDITTVPLHANVNGNVQPKLDISTADDIYEQEADRIADRVMRRTDVDPQTDDREVSRDSAVSRLQHQCYEQEMQRKPVHPVHTGSLRPGTPASVRDAIRSSACRIDPVARSWLEPRFDRDLGNVRVHTGLIAERAARDIQAQAFTYGRDIVFGHGYYQPGTSSGRRLLAHEVTHVAQQSEDSQLRRSKLIQRAQTGRPTPQAPYFTYELDTARNTYSALASYYGLARWQDIQDATPGHPEIPALRMGQAVRIPARNLPTGTVQVVGTEPALVVSEDTLGVDFPWGNNSNANRIGRASRGTVTNVGETVPNNFRRAWIESTNLQNRADGLIAELQALNRAIGNNVYGYLPTPNVRLASRNVPTTDVDILTRMIFGEQRSQGRDAMVVAAWIVRNRYVAGWGGSYAALLTDHEFHALSTTRTQDMTRLTGVDAQLWTTAQQVAQGVVDGTIADPTGGRGFYFGNGNTVQQRMDFCQRHTTGYHTEQVAGTNLFWSNGDYTGGTTTAPQCGPPLRL